MEGRADADHRRATGVDAVDDLGVVDALEVDRGDSEVAVAELADISTACVWRTDVG